MWKPNWDSPGPLIGAGVVLGAILGATLLAAFCDDPVAWADSDHRADWLGFWGGVAGGLMTLIAAAIAFGLTRRQVMMQQYELAALQEEQEARQRTVMILLLRSATMIQVDAENYLRRLKFCSDGEVVPSSHLGKLRTIEAVLGYGELWRLGIRTIEKVIDLDLRIADYNNVVTRLAVSQSEVWIEKEALTNALTSVLANSKIVGGS
ncbi:hypothetical protein J2X65_003208 [Ancylobacter sp. 3268]|uniref:hypothetical protein n=1 Tax=Ancylobacter sp. 3268 TaxID=2817752 RepID=UPI002865DED1|nr:hypothetical protein [Ancylobacter sp. 3268]MDR6953845.1 hypothetical protein [Ancylobacter sp. 3268]